MSKNLDSLISEVVNEDMGNIPIPPKEEAWGNIITELQKRRKKEKIQQIAFGFMLGVVVTCALFVVTYLLHMV